MVSLWTQRQPLSLGNIISVIYLFQTFYFSWSTLYSESLLLMFFLSLWFFFMANVTLPYLLETQHCSYAPIHSESTSIGLFPYHDVWSSSPFPLPLHDHLLTYTLALSHMVLRVSLLLTVYSLLFFFCLWSPSIFLHFDSFICFLTPCSHLKNSIQIIWSSSCPLIWIEVSLFGLLSCLILFLCLCLTLSVCVHLGSILCLSKNQFHLICLCTPSV